MGTGGAFHAIGAARASDSANRGRKDRRDDLCAMLTPCTRVLVIAPSHVVQGRPPRQATPAGGSGSFKPSRVGAPDGLIGPPLRAHRKQEVRATKVGPGKVNSSMIHKRSEVLG